MYRIGVDLGGTTISAAVVNDSLELLGETTIPTTTVRDANLTGQIIAADISRLAFTVTEQAGLSFDDIEMIGVGVPASVENNLVIDANNIGLVNFPLADEIKNRTGKRVELINDARAAGLGEYTVRYGKNSTASMFMVTLGTGIGGCHIYQGKVIEGINNAAGEVGHTVLVRNGRNCTCGRKGCFETYASARALVNDAQAALLLAGSSNRVENGKDFFRLLNSCDPVITEVFDTYTDYLAEGIANIVNFLQPDEIVIGGGISAVGDTLLAPLVPKVRNLEFTQHSNVHTNIEISKLGNKAGIIGSVCVD